MVAWSMAMQEEAMSDLKILEERQDMTHLLDTIKEALNAVALLQEVHSTHEAHLTSPDVSGE